MIQPVKKKEVEILQDRLKDKKSIVLVDYKGIDVEEVQELRARMREANVDYFVAKNTLIKIALENLDIKDLHDYLVGPTAIALSEEDEVAPAREIAKFKKEVTKKKEYPSFKIGLINNELMEVKDLEKFAELPDKDELIAQVLRGFNAPITGFVGTLKGIIRKFVYVLNAIEEKKEENK